MNITRRVDDTLAQQWIDWHVLTIAETHPSKLDTYARLHRRLSSEVIQNFVAQVNKSDTSGSLHPTAPLSALPQRIFAHQPDATGSHILDDLKRLLAAFIEANRRSIHATRVVVDFKHSGTPLAASYISAIEEVFLLRGNGSSIEEVVILI